MRLPVKHSETCICLGCEIRRAEAYPALQAENARLRDALVRIVEHPFADCVPVPFSVDFVRDIARAALVATADTKEKKA